jgi:hypothetical protein
MHLKEKAELLDNLEIELLRDGYKELSFSLEEVADLHPDRRWREISLCLSEETLPEKYRVFLRPDPDWAAAAEALT